MIYYFDSYELDTVRYELRYSSVPVHIEPKVFDILIYLIQHEGQVVTKEELHTHLWADQFVSDSALTYCIASARKAVGDTGRVQRTIKTVHRRGYRFIAQVYWGEESLDEAPEHSAGAAETTRLSLSAPLSSPVSLVPERRQPAAMWCSMAGASELAQQPEPEEQHEMILRAQTLLHQALELVATLPDTPER
jgi:DNA-binding winged helix-turn-helix (wHTH) protein